MHLCKYWYHGSASTSSGSPSRIYQCMYLWCNTSCGSIGSATTGGGPLVVKKKVGSASAVQEEGRGIEGGQAAGAGEEKCNICCALGPE